jgi:preprotein translocase subunit YajC
MLNTLLIILQSQSPYGTFIFMGLIFLVFYFFIIRPQSKKQRDTRKFIDALKVGDEVVTISGLHGKVSEIEDETFLIEVSRGLKLKFEKSAVSMEASKKVQSKK